MRHNISNGRVGGRSLCAFDPMFDNIVEVENKKTWDKWDKIIGSR